MEPVDAWVRLAAAADAIQRVAAALHRGLAPAVEDWKAIPFLDSYGEENFPQSPPRKVDARDWERFLLERRRVFLGFAIHTWIDLGKVSMEFSWEKPRARLRVIPRSLFGALGLELAMKVGKICRSAWCSDCGKGYEPKRTPRAGEENFCKDCGKRGAWRLAQERRREKLKRAAQSEKRRRSSRGAGR